MNLPANAAQSLVLLFTLFLCSCKGEQSKNEDEEDLMAQARSIHEDVLTLDTHVDINVSNFTDSINYSKDTDTQVNLPKMKAGGLDVAWFVVYTGQDSLNPEGFQKAYENAISKFKAIHRLVEEIAPEEIALATNSEEVRAIHNSGKKVAMIGIENGYSVGTDLKNIAKFYDLGGRYMSLAHNGHSQLSDSNTGEADSIWLHNGLSKLGEEAVVEMNRLGMMIDVSHPSKEAMRQMIALSKAPIIASHSSARAMSEHSRNLDDEQLQWMKENGGVVQAVAFSAYLNHDKYEARQRDRKEIGLKLLDSLGMEYLEGEELEKLSEEEREAYEAKIADLGPELDRKMKNTKTVSPAVDVADFVDHIDYLVEKLGIDHVGISSDFDGGGGIAGWEDASESLNVTKELLKRNYNKEQIAKLWSGNLLRVLDEVQAVAQNIQDNE